MMRRIIGVVCVLAFFATCGRKAQPPSSPTTPDLTSGLQTAPAVSVAINGPTQIQPGEAQQFTAVARLSDGTSQDVTATASWRTSTGPILSVTSGGLVTALMLGEATISLTYQGRSAFLSVVSIPNGTGILTGYVRESTFAIGNARVEVVGGRFAGQSVTTLGSGFYRFYGIVGDLQVRAGADGYVAQTIQINVAPLATPRRDQTLNFDLTTATPVLSLTGNYNATLRVSPSCGARFPPEIMVRQYQANITQDRSRLTITLGGAEFAAMGNLPLNRFDGRAKPNAVDLQVGTFYYYYYYYYSFGFVERILRPPVGKWGFSQTTYLTVVGTASGPATTGSLSTSLNGTLGFVDAPTGFVGRRTTLASCRASDHQLLFTRQ